MTLFVVNLRAFLFKISTINMQCTAHRHQLPGWMPTAMMHRERWERAIPRLQDLLCDSDDVESVITAHMLNVVMRRVVDAILCCLWRSVIPHWMYTPILRYLPLPYDPMHIVQHRLCSNTHFMLVSFPSGCKTIEKSWSASCCRFVTHSVEVFRLPELLFYPLPVCTTELARRCT